MKKIFLISFLILIFFALVPQQIQAGLVPCGLAEDDPDQSGDQAVPCTLCHFFVLFQNIINFLLFPPPAGGGIVPLIAILMIAIGGFMYMFAGGNPGLLKQAKSLLVATLIGLFIIYGAWLIVDFLLVWSGLVSTNFGGWDPTAWFTINCP